MSRLLFFLTGFFLKALFSLRYRVEEKHLKTLFDRGYHKKGGVLFLPNHVAQIDSLILNALLIGHFRPRPVVVTHFYFLKGAHFLMRWIGAIPIPDFKASANRWKIKQVERVLEKVRKGMEQRENFLIYPSGRLKTSGIESLGGNSLVHRLLLRAPQTKIVLVRITGLWGSSFSRAISDKTPDFWSSVLGGIKVLLKNGLFFTPRRKVTVDFSLAPQDFPRDGSRKELNRYLENWLNQYASEEGGAPQKKEELKLVSFSCFFEDVPSVNSLKKVKEKKEAANIPANIRNDLLAELAHLSGRSIKEIDENSDLVKELGLDSLDHANIQVFLEKKHGFQMAPLGTIQTVGDLFHQVAKEEIEEHVEIEEPKKEDKWLKEQRRFAAHYAEGETIQEVFLNSCGRMKSNIACGDRLFGFITYHQLKMRVLILARYISKTFPDPHLGVILPSSLGAYVTILAILMAGKTPVLLNWTAGSRSLNFAHHLLKLEVALSFRRFLEGVESLDLGLFEDRITLLDDFRQNISLWDKFFGFFLSRKKSSKLIEYFRLKRIKSDQQAVILFTSGTENYPKAVPLSHRNLITNHKAALSVVDLNSSDVFLNFLPPFHAFGLSAAALLPLLSGIRVFFSPDPTNSTRIAKECDSLGITLVCATPSFFSNLFKVACPYQLRSVRMFVSGSEKAPKRLFDLVNRLEGDRRLIEGYGITECSPIVTLAQSGKASKGVGTPIPGVELRIIDKETGQRVSPLETGEICIKGPNVFEGYMGENVSSPFFEIEGERWYRSGDLGSIREDGTLLLAGRISRFIKIAGEMVSLLAMEEEIARAAQKEGSIKEKDKEVPLVLGVIEKELDRPLLVLFATFDISTQKVNEILRSSGFGSIVKIQRVERVEQIPMTGTGKVHFHRINEKLKKMACI